MRLFIFSLPFLALIATLAQGLRAITTRAPAPYQPVPSASVLHAARAEVEAYHAQQPAQYVSSSSRLIEAQPVSIRIP
jgi:hypothetical protein